MNIIFLIDSPYPFYTGGRETWLYNVSERLCKNNKVYIVCEKVCDEEKRRYGKMPENDSKIEILQYASFKSWFVTDLFLHSYIIAFNQLLEKVTMMKVVERIVKQNPNKTFYIISMDTIFTADVAYKIKKKYKNVKFVNSVRGPHATVSAKTFPLLSSYYFKKEIFSLQNADRVWVNGEDTKIEVLQHGIEPVVIKNGIDYARKDNDICLLEGMKVSGCEMYILTIGSLLDIKGYPELINAVSYVKEKYGIKIGMTAFGKGDSTRYKELARKKGIEDQVLFAGVVKNTIEFGKYFDAIACLSGGGGLSMACLESLATGVPVVAWDSSVYTQMIENMKNGILVREKDYIELAHAMMWIMNNKKEAVCIGKKGQQSVEKYDWNYVVDSIIKDLKSI